MYFASTASKNSSCLSRQVGACITDNNGDLISVGWNDVPCFGGNLYKRKFEIKEEKDNRCVYALEGKCFNDERKEEIIEKLIRKLVSEKSVVLKDKAKFYEVLQKSELKDLIEFSRAIHAEMHAIISGSQKTGDKMIGGKIYCTTYPCHICARHIVVAGIHEIYYIEPYPKSLATKLHYDSITENEKDEGKVKILMFNGVAPSRYIQLFTMGENYRKDTKGKYLKIQPEKAKPLFSETLEALYTLESYVIKKLTENDLAYK